MRDAGAAWSRPVGRNHRLPCGVLRSDRALLGVAALYGWLALWGLAVLTVRSSGRDLLSAKRVAWVDERHASRRNHHRDNGHREYETERDGEYDGVGPSAGPNTPRQRHGPPLPRRQRPRVLSLREARG